jgi:Ni/Co efflux regulator RcnB
VKKIIYAVLLAVIVATSMAQAGTERQKTAIGEQNKMILEKVSPFGHDDCLPVWC